MNQEIMTAKQVAEYLQLNEMTIYKLAREGKIPASRIGRVWRFRKELIDDWLTASNSQIAAVLVIHPESDKEIRYPLRNSVVTLGSGPMNDIVLSGDTLVAERHAVIIQQNEHHVIISPSSTVRIYVNGKPIDRHPLKDGDEIKLGQTLLTFQTEFQNSRI